MVTAEQIKKIIQHEEFKNEWREDMETESYHADKSAVNFSSLVHIDKSDFAFANAFWGKPRAATKRMNFGNLAHKAILEGGKFKDNYVVVPEFQGLTLDGKMSSNSKNAKLQRESWLAEQNKDSIIVTQDERDKLFFMIDSILSNTNATKLLQNGKPEVTGYWRDPETKINLRMKADFISFDVDCLVDVKTTPDIRWDRFRKSVELYRYDLQMEFYSQGILNITGKAPENKAWVVIESEPPFECRIHHVGVSYETVGAFEFTESLKRLRKAIDSGIFTQGSDEIFVGECSNYFFNKYKALNVLSD